MAKKDLNQLAKFITNIASGEIENSNKDNKIISSNVIGRKGMPGGMISKRFTDPANVSDLFQISIHFLIT